MLNSHKNTRVGISFLIKNWDLQKETLTQVFSCKFGKFFKNFFYTEHLRATVSVLHKSYKFPMKTFTKSAKSIFRILLPNFFYKIKKITFALCCSSSLPDIFVLLMKYFIQVNKMSILQLIWRTITYIAAFILFFYPFKHSDKHSNKQDLTLLMWMEMFIAWS